MCIKWDSTEWGTIDCLNHDDIEELQVLLPTSYKKSLRYRRFSCKNK